MSGRSTSTKQSVTGRGDVGLRQPQGPQGSPAERLSLPQRTIPHDVPAVSVRSATKEASARATSWKAENEAHAAVAEGIGSVEARSSLLGADDMARRPVEDTTTKLAKAKGASAGKIGVGRDFTGARGAVQPAAQDLVRGNVKEGETTGRARQAKKEAQEAVNGDAAAAAAAKFTESGETEAEESSYWPIVRQYIQAGGHPGHPRRIKPVCPVCSDELTIHGIDPAKDELIDRAFYSVNDEMPPFTRCAAVLCGHLFCLDCLERAFAADREMFRGRSCPVCRFEVDCEKCGELGCVVNLPVTGIAARSAGFPGTMLKGRRCSHCVAREM